MIQNIGEHEYHNEYTPRRPGKDDFLLIYSGSKMAVLMDGDTIQFPTFEKMEQISGNDHIYEDYTYLFSIDEMNFYLGIIWNSIQSTFLWLMPDVFEAVRLPMRRLPPLRVGSFPAGMVPGSFVGAVVTK